MERILTLDDERRHELEFGGPSIPRYENGSLGRYSLKGSNEVGIETEDKKDV
jgi:hypothetical protein